jgi:acylphosphatase
MKIRAMVRVSGLVQGVAFRHYTVQTAELHGVTGWVRNLPDRSVQACLEGEENDVEAVAQWCRRGPSSARVDEITVEKGSYTGEFKGFGIRYDHE